MKVVKRVIIIGVLIIIIALLATFIFSRFYKITLIGDQDIYLNIGSEYFENGYKATLFNNNYTNVKVTNNIDTSKIGDYYVKYSIKFLFYDINVKRNVHVVDKESPIITLNGDKHIYLNEHQKFEDPGFSATDNIDGDLTASVIIDSSVNEKSTGVYEVTYKVSDSSKNESIVKREVEVIKDGLLTTDVDKFWLKGSFEDVILKYEENAYDYFDNTIFLGDSNTTFLHLKGNFISAKQTWGKNNLNIAQINSSVFTTFVNRNDSTLENAINLYKPKYLIISTGINAPLYMRKENYISETEKFIKYMRENHSDITILFTATFPITTTGSLNISLQKKINEYNYYLVEICHKYKVNFINFSDEVRGEDGYANASYFDCVEENDCGFHLNKAGREKYIDYIKHLNFERSIQ
ncbi:MAG: DUF5011 domain-containing protein [Bacilli bacterium]|nr:DUF5011 domain-containing protein [Bacilli bacterium]